MDSNTERTVEMDRNSKGWRRTLRVVWSWCRRHPWLMLIMGLFVVPFAYDAWRLYGWRPDIVVEGQIVDFDTKQPIEGVWVPIYIRAYGTTAWILAEGANPGMISPLSTVVQTNREGHFSYRVSTHDSVQYAGFMEYLVQIGAYRKGYESVDAETGRSQKGLEGALPFTVNDSYSGWPSLKRLADDSLEQRERSRDDIQTGVNYFLPLDATLPHWASFLHQVAADELDYWCRSPSVREEDRSVAAMSAVSTLVRYQEMLLETRLVDSSAPIIASNLQTLRDAYKLATPGFDWTEPEVDDPSALAAMPKRDMRVLSVMQQQALCDVMRRQSSDILQQSLGLGSSAP